MQSCVCIHEVIIIANNYYHYRQREDSTVHLRNTTFYLDQMQIEELKLVQYKNLVFSYALL